MDLIDLEAETPTLFWTFACAPENGWQTTPLSELIRGEDRLKFDVEEEAYAPEDRFAPMVLAPDGLYHWRSKEKPEGHWWGVLAETPTHVVLTGNWRDDRTQQGVFVAVWPKGMTRRPRQSRSARTPKTADRQRKRMLR